MNTLEGNIVLYAGKLSLLLRTYVSNMVKFWIKVFTVFYFLIIWNIAAVFKSPLFRNLVSHAKSTCH